MKRLQTFMDCLSAYKPRMHVHMTSTHIRAEIQKIVLTGCISVSVTRGGIQHFADFICESPLGRSCVFVPRAPMTVGMPRCFPPPVRVGGSAVGPMYQRIDCPESCGVPTACAYLVEQRYEL